MSIYNYQILVIMAEYMAHCSSDLMAFPWPVYLDFDLILNIYTKKVNLGFKRR